MIYLYNKSLNGRVDAIKDNLCTNIGMSIYKFEFVFVHKFITNANL